MKLLLKICYIVVSISFFSYGVWNLIDNGQSYFELIFWFCVVPIAIGVGYSLFAFGFLKTNPWTNISMFIKLMIIGGFLLLILYAKLACYASDCAGLGFFILIYGFPALLLSMGIFTIGFIKAIISIRKKEINY